MLDYLPPETIFLVCEPEAISEHADSYAGQVPPGDPFFISWLGFQDLLRFQNRTVVEIEEAEAEFQLAEPPDRTEIAEPCPGLSLTGMHRELPSLPGAGFLESRCLPALGGASA